MKKISLISLLILCFTISGFAQMTRKPSPTRAPKDATVTKPDAKDRFLTAIKSQEDFDRISRVYHKDTPYALPHAMFVIDRKNKNKIYYVNSQKYRFHKDFLIGNYLVLKGENLFENIYINENRRFIVGTIAWQKTVEAFTFEFWEGDMIPAQQIKLTYDIINKTFHEPVAFKPNSIRQDELSANLDIERITSDEISKNQEYLALNAARGVGRVHIIDKLDDTVEIGYNEIIVLKEIPQNLPPVAGIIIAKPSSPLSHINILAKGWGIPNAYIKDADKLFKEYDTWWVEFETTLTDYKIKLADKQVLDKWRAAEEEKGKVFKAPPSNLEITRLAALRQIGKKDSIAYGAKAANLGEVANAKIPNITVPDGFSIPFHYYYEFMHKHDLDDKIADLMIEYDFVHNPRFRRQKLEEFRQEIQNAEFDEKLKAEIIKKWRTELGGKGVFVRSSSNAEDMPNFSGAGLYTTVPNVKEEEKLIEAVKTVWASLWNFDAYDTRERNFIDHRGTYMGVFIQIGVNMDNGGVMITKDPFDKENKGAVYIAATRGHNIQVVGGEGSSKGERIPEQILFTPKSNSVQVLTRSNQETEIKFDENGGLKETPISVERRVLTDATARSLVNAALAIKKLFGNKKDQDIEWGYQKGQIFILQSRPYIEN
ncbi:MAG TPA: PEP/pyruvate-binding domain-containing protein [Pyrinomonadaceae bacterium]|nr:PEP/pyruvate-binding domain-containing protein [Pyrinomonadaceae bacterium]